MSAWLDGWRVRITPAGVGLLLTALILVVILAGYAFGAEPNTTVAIGPFWAEVVRPILEGVLVALAIWVATKIAEYFGVKIEAHHRQALHTAAMTAINFALGRLDPRMVNAEIDVRNEVVATATNYVLSSVPKAIKKLKADEGRVTQIVESKLTALAQGNASIVPPGSPTT